MLWILNEGILIKKSHEGGDLEKIGEGMEGSRSGKTAGQEAEGGKHVQVYERSITGTQQIIIST